MHKYFLTDMKNKRQLREHKSKKKKTVILTNDEKITVREAQSQIMHTIKNSRTTNVKNSNAKVFFFKQFKQS